MEFQLKPYPLVRQKKKCAELMIFLMERMTLVFTNACKGKVYWSEMAKDVAEIQMACMQCQEPIGVEDLCSFKMHEI